MLSVTSADVLINRVRVVQILTILFYDNELSNRCPSTAPVSPRLPLLHMTLSDWRVSSPAGHILATSLPSVVLLLAVALGGGGGDVTAVVGDVTAVVGDGHPLHGGDRLPVARRRGDDLAVLVEHVGARAELVDALRVDAVHVALVQVDDEDDVCKRKGSGYSSARSHPLLSQWRLQRCINDVLLSHRKTY